MASITEWKEQTVREIVESAKKVGFPLDDYQKQCGFIACGLASTTLQAQGISSREVDMVALKTSIENVAFTSLNGAAMPPECYVDVRRGYNGKPTTVTIKPQGAGWEKLTAKWGRDLKSLSPCYLVREDDDFKYPYFDGERMHGPSFQQRNNSLKKVMYVVYIATLVDGSKQYLIADRQSVAKNVIAQIKQNCLYSKEINEPQKEELFKRLDGMALDDIINDEELKAKKLINPTYLSPASRESMIETKMKNNALKSYPKDYGNEIIRKAVEGLAYEDEDYGIPKDKTIERVVAETSGDAIPDFDAPNESEAKDNGKAAEEQ